MADPIVPTKLTTGQVAQTCAQLQLLGFQFHKTTQRWVKEIAGGGWMSWDGVHDVVHVIDGID